MVDVNENDGALCGVGAVVGLVDDILAVGSGCCDAATETPLVPSARSLVSLPYTIVVMLSDAMMRMRLLCPQGGHQPFGVTPIVPVCAATHGLDRTIHDDGATVEYW